LDRYSDDKRTATPIEANIIEAIRAEITARIGICADKADLDKVVKSALLYMNIVNLMNIADGEIQIFW
jgi:hypothetical protein